MNGSDIRRRAVVTAVFVTAAFVTAAFVTAAVLSSRQVAIVVHVPAVLALRLAAGRRARAAVEIAADRLASRFCHGNRKNGKSDGRCRQC